MSPTPPKVPRPFPAPLADSAELRRLADVLAAHPHADDRRSALDAFWEQARSPLIEPVADDPNERIVTFLWRDADAAAVLLFVNRLTDERDLPASLMRRLDGTDVWHLSYRMRADWRASYAFLPQRPGARPPWLDDSDQVAIRAALDAGIPDPRNPDTCRNGRGMLQSAVSLPGADPQRWLPPARTWRGRLAEHRTPGGRAVWTYLPVPPRRGDRLPLVVALDGEVWTGPQNLPGTVDALIADAQLPPIALVLVGSGDRTDRWRDLGGLGKTPDWLADELLPWATEMLPVGRDPAGRIAVGQSLGAAVALQTAARRPDAFGGFVSQSASLWQPGVAEYVAEHLPARTRGHLEVGLQEWVLLEPHRSLRDRLAARHVHPHYREYNGGHDYACWRGGIALGLRQVLGRQPSRPSP
ncbi:enterochelin esterase domain-containing protein [Propionicicella superfundia]|uniref:enterochelin esterase domain-containing protein n=1 Tax=Propionicicella superfundia TaxID=348582 RepID=UPI000406F7A9|nr:enterochelin esterase domain-containing protein [Propionicicella superfundia]